MKRLPALLVLSLLLSSASAWKVGDKFCEREQGESCVNSPDCPTCMVRLNTSIFITETQGLLAVTVESGEPESLGIILTVSKSDKALYSKILELPGMQMRSYEFPVPREEADYDLAVAARDRDIDTMWAREFVTVEGLASKNPGAEIFIPAVALLVFFGILYFGLRKTKPAGPYAEGPDFVPYPPTGMPPAPPAPQRAPIAEEEIIVVPRKRKYYVKKKRQKKKQ